MPTMFSEMKPAHESLGPDLAQQQEGYVFDPILTIEGDGFKVIFQPPDLLNKHGLDAYFCFGLSGENVVLDLYLKPSAEQEQSMDSKTKTIVRAAKHKDEALRAGLLLAQWLRSPNPDRFPQSGAEFPEILVEDEQLKTLWEQSQAGAMWDSEGDIELVAERLMFLYYLTEPKNRSQFHDLGIGAKAGFTTVE